MHPAELTVCVKSYPASPGLYFQAFLPPARPPAGPTPSVLGVGCCPGAALRALHGVIEPRAVRAGRKGVAAASEYAHLASVRAANMRRRFQMGHRN